jgi:hypothetical protein
MTHTFSPPFPRVSQYPSRSRYHFANRAVKAARDFSASVLSECRIMAARIVSRRRLSLPPCAKLQTAGSLRLAGAWYKLAKFHLATTAVIDQNGRLVSDSATLAKDGRHGSARLVQRSLHRQVVGAVTVKMIRDRWDSVPKEKFARFYPRQRPSDVCTYISFRGFVFRASVALEI